MAVAQWRRKDFGPNLPKEFWVAAGYLDGQTDILTEAEGREKDI